MRLGASASNFRGYTACVRVRSAVADETTTTREVAVASSMGLPEHVGNILDLSAYVLEFLNT